VNFTKNNLAGVGVVEIEGKLVGGLDNSQHFHDFIGGILEGGTTSIVVRLRDVPWANSQGIGMLIGAYTSAKKAGGQLVLAEVGPRIRDVLAVTKLYLIFETFDTVGQAVDRLLDRRPANHLGNAAESHRAPRAI